MKPTVYIDGKEGTTGLQIYDRLQDRDDIQLILIDDEKRKDPKARKECIHAADIVFLCLPDAAAREAVELAKGSRARIIDTSTAHRTAPDWVYGFPELRKTQRERIADAQFVANPGCHATGYISAVYPLIQEGPVRTDDPPAAYSLTGYSGGGKAMIAEYESADCDTHHKSWRIYATHLKHKHLPEISHVCRFDRDCEPLFSPILGNYYKGMATTVMLPCRDSERVHALLREYYRNEEVVSVAPLGGDNNLHMISAEELAGFDSLRLIVCGHWDNTTVTALFDNLGKGASGAAVQNMNLMLGFEETKGLRLRKDFGTGEAKPENA